MQSRPNFLFLENLPFFQVNEHLQTSLEKFTQIHWCIGSMKNHLLDRKKDHISEYDPVC